MTLFNKPADLTYSEVLALLPYMDMSRAVWVMACDMTDKEKQDNPGYETTKGYRRRQTLKEAWQEWWSGASGKDRGKLLALPNFDADIFLEITGIDVRCGI